MLYEVAYTLKVQKEDKNDLIKNAHFSLTDVFATIVTLENPVTASCSSMSTVQQKFSVTFESDSEDLIQARSGNPGYLVGKPLLLGRKNGDYLDVYEKGYRVTGAQSNGLCTETANT